MAIISVKTGLKVAATQGRKTSMVWTMNNGTLTLNSNENVGAGNGSSSVLGKALNTQATARLIPQATNLKAIASV